MLLLAALLTCGAHPTYALVRVSEPLTVVRQDGTYRAQTVLRFKVAPAIVAPHGSDRAFNDHVRGHQIVAQRVAGSLNGIISSNGKTPHDARKQLARALSQMTSDQQKELMREERVYDSVTENGRAQDQGPVYGLPGGRNASGLCP